MVNRHRKCLVSWNSELYQPASAMSLYSTLSFYYAPDPSPETKWKWDLKHPALKQRCKSQSWAWDTALPITRLFTGHLWSSVLSSVETKLFLRSSPLWYQSSAPSSHQCLQEVPSCVVSLDSEHQIQLKSPFVFLAKLHKQVPLVYTENGLFIHQVSFLKLNNSLHVWVILGTSCKGPQIHWVYFFFFSPYCEIFLHSSPGMCAHLNLLIDKSKPVLLFWKSDMFHYGRFFLKIPKLENFQVICGFGHYKSKHWLAVLIKKSASIRRQRRWMFCIFIIPRNKQENLRTIYRSPGHPNLWVSYKVSHLSWLTGQPPMCHWDCHTYGWCQEWAWSKSFCLWAAQCQAN